MFSMNRIFIAITILICLGWLALPLFAEGTMPGRAIVDGTLDLERKAELVDGKVDFSNSTVEIKTLIIHEAEGITLEVDLTEYTRRDGTHQPTGDWDFNDKMFYNASTVEADAFEGDGSALTGVDAEKLNGQLASFYALASDLLNYYEKADTYSTSEIQAILDDYYTTSEIDSKLGDKMDLVGAGTPGNFLELDGGGQAADSGVSPDDYYTTSEIDSAIGDYLKRDGSNAMTGDFDLDGNNIVNGHKATFDDTLECQNLHVNGTVELGTTSGRAWYGEGDGKLYFSDNHVELNITDLAAAMEAIESPYRVLFVRQDGNDSNTGSAVSPFVTIAHAYSVAESMTPTVNDPVIINILGKFTEQVTVDTAGIHFYGYGQNVSQWHYAGNALIITDNGVDPEPWDLKVKGISFQSTDAGEYAVKIQGIAGTSLGGNEIQFMDCRLEGTKSIHADIVNGIDYQNTYIMGECLYEQTGGIWYEGSESAGDITNDWDDAGSKPSWGSHYGVNFVQHLPRGSVTLLNSGTQGENYRPRELDDSGTSVSKVWSSDKINSELLGKLSTSAVLDDLADVNASTPGDGQALVWNDGASEWQNQTIAAGTNTTEVESIIDSYSYNSTEVYTKTEGDNRYQQYDKAGVIVTCASSGADFSNIHTAIDYVATRGGGTIVCIGQIAFTPASRDVSNITFIGQNSDLAIGTTLFWSSGAGAWYGTNVRFENLIIYCRNASSGSLFTASGDNYIVLNNIGYFTGGAGATGNAISCGGHECVVVCHNVKKWGGSYPLTLNDSSATIYGFDKSEIHCTTPANLYLDSSSTLSGGTPVATTYIDNASKVTYSGTVSGDDVAEAIDQLDSDKADASDVYTKSESDATLEAYAYSKTDIDTALSNFDLNDLADVNAGSPSDNQSLTWDNATSKWVPETISTDIDLTFTDIFYIDPVNGNDTTGDGSFSKKYATIGKCLSDLGQPSDAADYQRVIKIDLGTGNSYTEDLIVPHRALMLYGQGCIIDGEITREIADEYEYGISSSVFRGCLTIWGISGGLDNHQLRRQGIKVNGGYHCVVASGMTGSTTHDTYFHGVTFDDTVETASNTGTEVLYAENCRFFGNVYSAGNNFYIQRWANNDMDGYYSDPAVLKAGAWVNADDIVFSSGSGKTVEIRLTSFSSSSDRLNFRNCIFEKCEAYIPSGSNIKMDAASYTSWLNNVTIKSGSIGTITVSEAAKAISYSGTVTGATVKAAIDQLDTDKLDTTGQAADSDLLDGEDGTHYLDRANHTGTQLASTISDFDTAADARISAANLDDLSDVDAPNPSDGQALVWDSGTGTWTSETISASGVFEKASGVIRETDTNYDGDFVIGSGQLDDDGSHDYRLLWDQSLAAFRAGQVTGTQWDEASRGSNSAAFGYNCTASGFGSFAAGSTVAASNSRAIALGNQCTASGADAVSIGYGPIASGGKSIAIGSGAGANASGDSTIAIGNGLAVSGSRSIAFGMSNSPLGTVTQANAFVVMGGNVGIGELSPSNLLDVAGTIEVLDIVCQDTIEANAFKVGHASGYVREESGNLRFSDNYQDFSLNEMAEAIDEKTTPAEVRSEIDSYSYNSTEVYTKDQADNLLNDKADSSSVYTIAQADATVEAYTYGKSEVYTQTETDDLLDDKADSTAVYTIAETDATIEAYAYDKAETYTQTEVNNLLDDKADSSAVYTIAEVDATIEAYTYDKSIIDGKIRTDAEIEDVIDAYSYNSTEIYTMTEADNLLDDKLDTTGIAADSDKLDGNDSTYYAAATAVYTKAEADATIEAYTYSSGDIDTALSGKEDTGTAYTKAESDSTLEAYTYSESEIDSALGDKADASAVYTKAESDSTIEAYAYAKADTYTQTEADNLLNDKADSSSVYTIAEADATIEAYTYSESEIDSALSGKLSTSGTAADSDKLDNHDSSYFEVAGTAYTKAETDATIEAYTYDSDAIDTALSGKLSTSGTAADSDKLDAQDGSYYLARGNHTGTQLASTISDFSTASDARIAAANLNDLNDLNAGSPSDGQVLTFDNGTSKWIAATPAGGAGVFEEVTNVVREKSDGGYDNDFVFGSTQLNHSASYPRRFFFDDGQGAFRAGETITTGYWDNAQLGYTSAAFGSTTKADGDYTLAFGQYSQATGDWSFAGGYLSIASGNYSFAFGDEANAKGNHCIAIGDGAFAGNAVGDIDNIAIGTGSYSGYGNDGGIAIGKIASAGSDNSMAIGNSASISSSSDRSIAIGYNCTVSQPGSMIIGTSATSRTLNQAGFCQMPDMSLVIGTSIWGKGISVDTDANGYTCGYFYNSNASGKGIQVVSGTQGIQVKSGGTVMDVRDASNNILLYTDQTKTSIKAPNTTQAPTMNGAVTFWIDESAGALKFSVKYSDGTAKTGTLTFD